MGSSFVDSALARWLSTYRLTFFPFPYAVFPKFMDKALQVYYTLFLIVTTIIIECAHHIHEFRCYV